MCCIPAASGSFARFPSRPFIGSDSQLTVTAACDPIKDYKAMK